MAFSTTLAKKFEGIQKGMLAAGEGIEVGF